MNNYSMMDSLTYPNKSFVLQLADQVLLPLRVACHVHVLNLEEEGNETEGKTHHVVLRILAGLVVLLTLPVTLLALTIKWWKREEWQKASSKDLQSVKPVSEEENDELISENDELILLPEEQEEFGKFIQQEWTEVQHLDVKLLDPLPGSWRAYGKSKRETNQTLVSYINVQKGRTWPDERPLFIQRIGIFSDIDLRIISITSGYLHIFHHLSLCLEQTTLTIEELKTQYVKAMETRLSLACQNEQEQQQQEFFASRYKEKCDRMEHSFPREDGQYDADLVLDLMQATLLSPLKKESKKGAQLIAFTSEDLFTPYLQNFVFGCACLVTGVGIWSKARFGDPRSSPQAFQLCLLRMLKISAHEFGHMRGFPHCTDYECNMGGYMSLKELDSRPLLYCMQDMAKICYVTRTSMLSQHKKILNFFQNFNQTYGLDYDFSKEIKTLKERVVALTKEAKKIDF